MRPEIAAFIKRNIVFINRKVVNCLDGRQTNGKSIKRQGADAGEAAATAYLLPELGGREIVSDYAEAAKAIQRPLFAHTDSHEIQGQLETLGCGHLRYMLLYPDLFGITAAQILSIYQELRSHPHVRWNIYNDHHDEEHVLINNSPTKTINPYDRDLKIMSFVLDRMASILDLQKILFQLKKLKPGKYNSLEASQLQEAMDWQLSVTMTMLKGKNKVLANKLPKDEINPTAFLGIGRGY